MNRLLILAVLFLTCSALQAQSFTYRGTLDDNGVPAEGRYDLQLRLYADAFSDHALSSPIELRDIAVVNGRFAVSLDFPALPPQLYSGWLQVGVKSPQDSFYWPLPDRSEVMLRGGICPASWALDGNAGTNASQNFVGTTDGAPLILRSTAGVGINTTGVRGMLTVRGPDDFQSGPVIHLAGNSPSQFESGRIRFVNGTATGNYRGFYMHYDGSGNFFHIGGRDSTNQDPAEDRNIITLRRSAPNRVGIGNSAPSEALDVVGNIALTGGVKFAGAHYLSIHGTTFSELARLGGNRPTCETNFRGLHLARFAVQTCLASKHVQLPQGAVVRGFVVRFDDTDPAGECSVALRRVDMFSGDGSTVIIATATSTAAFSSGLSNISSGLINHTVNNESRALLLRATSDSLDCVVIGARIEYDLPNGFRP